MWLSKRAIEIVSKFLSFSTYFHHSPVTVATGLLHSIIWYVAIAIATVGIRSLCLAIPMLLGPMSQAMCKCVNRLKFHVISSCCRPVIIVSLFRLLRL